ncbi:MAG: FG-GAP-like repeat-containing protein [Phycisphaerales bacterium]
MKTRTTTSVLLALAGAAAAQTCDPADLFGPPDVLAAGDSVGSLAVGDLDGDGNADIVATNFDENTIGVYLGRGDGTFEARVVYSAGRGPSSLTLVDLDDDGDLDVVIASEREWTAGVFRNNGDGTLAPERRYQVGSLPFGVDAGDVDGDGDTDIVVSNVSGDSITVLRNIGGALLEDAGSFFAGNGARSVKLRDVDGDGDLDALVLARFDDLLSVVLNNGDGRFETIRSFSTGDSPAWLETGDIDGDGLLDVVVSNSEDTTVGVLRGLGDGFFGPHQAFAVPSRGFDLGLLDLADIDSDGDLDIAVSSPGAGSVYLLANDGSGFFDDGTGVAPGSRPFGIRLNDVDGDGDADLLVPFIAADVIGVYLNTCQAPPVVVTGPTNVVVDAGQRVELAVEAGGRGPFAYQWLRNGVAIDDAGPFSGAEASTLVIDPASGAEADVYSVVISNDAGAVESSQAFVTVRTPCRVDFDGDGTLTIFDFLAFSNAFDIGCP